MFSSILSSDARFLTLNKNRKQKLNNVNTLFQIENKIDEITESKPLETDLDNVQNDVQIIDEWTQKETEEKTTKDWCDYTEVDKINTEEKIENNNNEEKSLNDLLNQVAELDEIYSDTQARLLLLNETNTPEPKPENPAMDIDTDTYTSLQMAFKNPIEISLQDVITVQGPIIDVSLKRENDSDKLPPFPPKRIKKTLGSTRSINTCDQLEPVKRSSSFNTVRPQSQEFLAPIKKLPPTPTSTLPNPKKQGFFSKLFSKKTKKFKDDLEIQNENNIRNESVERGNSVIHIPLHGTNDLKIDEKSDINDNDEMINLDLTDAEHYALYTAMAPHATQSEFDELSCYYSPVEGGRILVATESSSLQKDS